MTTEHNTLLEVAITIGAVVPILLILVAFLGKSLVKKNDESNARVESTVGKAVEKIGEHSTTLAVHEQRISSVEASVDAVAERSHTTAQKATTAISDVAANLRRAAARGGGGG